MTTGIYALYWQEQDLVYIGQSQNIEARFKEHLNKMGKGTHTNYKVQDSYNLYGKPELVILEEANLDRLNDLEILWTKEFDSINNGLNIIEAGQVGWGVNSNASKYTKRQVLKVFSLLYRTELSHREISIRCNVPISLSADIKNIKTHLWLRQMYPQQYAKMLVRDANGIVSRTNSKHGLLKFINSITGNIETVENIYSFASKYSLETTHLYKVISGKRKSHKGWSLVKILNLNNDLN